MSQDRQDILIVDPDEICNPLRGERISAEIEDKRLMPMQIVALAVRGDPAFTPRYRVRIVFVTCGIREGRWHWSILADPIEDGAPLAPPEAWLMGDHGGWLSITVPPDPRMYIVRKESLEDQADAKPDATRDDDFERFGIPRRPACPWTRPSRERRVQSAHAARGGPAVAVPGWAMGHSFARR
jgi:hypothetical protein